MPVIKGTWWTQIIHLQQQTVKHTLLFRDGFNGSKSYPNWIGNFVVRANQTQTDVVSITMNEYVVSKGEGANNTKSVQPRIVASIGNSADNNSSRLKGFILVEINYQGIKFSKWFEVKTGIPGDALSVVPANPIQAAILCKHIEYPNTHILLQIGRKNGVWKDYGLTRRDEIPLCSSPRKSIVEIAEERRKKLRYAQVNIACGTFVFSRIGPAGTCGGKKTMAHCFVPGVSRPTIDLTTDTTFEHEDFGRVRLRAGRYTFTSNIEPFDYRTWKTVDMGGTYKRATSAIGTADSMKISKKAKMQTNAFKRI